MESFDRNGSTPHFSIEELKQIYDAAKRKDNISLRAKAEELFPDRDPICYENMHIWEGPGRAFKHNSDDYVRPKYVINAHPIIVGIMEDGTFYQFYGECVWSILMSIVGKEPWRNSLRWIVRLGTKK